MTSPRYCVIGAGAAGVSALHQLRRAGYHVECFEKSGRVGGHWHTDYEALHLITSRDMTHFEDFPMPADYPHFPRRDQVRAYIESYATHFRLDDVITFDTEIVSVSPEPTAHGPVGSAGWRVISSRGDEGTFDGVVVANGHLWDPHLPAIPGEFTGKQLHSGEYRNVGDLDGERVLIVGAGNSGCDLAVDVAQHRLEADIVMRHGVYFQPKMYFGRPRQEVPFLQDFSPEEQDLINRLLARVAIGQNSDYPGLPTPEARTLAGGPVTVNDLLLYWIHHGRVRVTGFNVRLPFLDDQLITWRDDVPVRYAGGILPEGAEKLYFVGLIAPRGPQIPIYGVQAKLIARMIALHKTPGADIALSTYFADLQEPETRIDIVRHVWLEQMADTERLLDALGAAGGARTPAPPAPRVRELRSRR